MKVRRIYHRRFPRWWDNSFVRISEYGRRRIKEWMHQEIGSVEVFRIVVTP